MWIEVIKAIGALGFVVTAGVGLAIFWLQRKDSKNSSRREVRVRLSQNYMTYHAELLRSSSNIEHARELFYSEYNAHETSKVLFMYMWLNAVHLEWHFVEHFGHSREAFRQTIDGMFGRFARQASTRDKFLLDDFDKLFSDFSPEFRSEIKDCMARNLPRSASSED